ncbi:hypothetical protein HN011_003364 [Eciton burchellii]|nr:hypothetical protein HN011_003364 [Eciton burchellii]
MRLKHVKTMLAERHQLDNGLPGCLVSKLNHEIRGFLTDEKAALSETINNSQVARAILVRVLQIVMSVSIYHHFGFPINLSSRGTHTCVHTCTRSDNTAWKTRLPRRKVLRVNVLDITLRHSVRYTSLDKKISRSLHRPDPCWSLRRVVGTWRGALVNVKLGQRKSRRSGWDILTVANRASCDFDVSSKRDLPNRESIAASTPHRYGISHASTFV